MNGISLEGRSVFVTGSNRGIGRALVVALIEKGVAKVFAGARDTSQLDDLVSEYGEKVIPVEVDVTQEYSLSQFPEGIADVSVLINNAGILAPDSLVDGTFLGSLERHLSVNVFGLARMVQLFIPVLQAQESAAVVNISSVAGLANIPMINSYSVSKAAVHSLTQGLRGELAEDDILVSGVYPGPIDTDMTKDFGDMQKEDVSVAAENIVQGIVEGEEDIYPDSMSQMIGGLYASSPKGVEEQFRDFSA